MYGRLVPNGKSSSTLHHLINNLFQLHFRVARPFQHYSNPGRTKYIQIPWILEHKWIERGTMPIISWYKSIAGWWFQPLWKIWKSIGIVLPNVWKKTSWSKPPSWSRMWKVFKHVLTEVEKNVEHNFMNMFMSTSGWLSLERKIMWVKQCHKPSPRHHHFYKWSWVVNWHCFIHMIYTNAIEIIIFVD